MTSLAKAMRTFISNGCDRSAMSVPAWAEPVAGGKVIIEVMQ